MSLEAILDKLGTAIDSLAKGQQEQWEFISNQKGYAPAATDMRLKATVGTGNSMQRFFAPDGLFADCELERPVINLTLQPLATILNMMPVVASVEVKRKYSYVSQVDDAEAGVGTTVCANCPEIGDIATCVGEFEKGRLCYETKTGEIDALIRKAHRGVPDDLFFVGDIRGVSAVPSRTMLQNPDFIMQGAVRFQLMLLGRQFQRTLGNWTWIGDKDDPTQNSTVPSTEADAWRSFDGLLKLIADDYGTIAKPFVTGTNCAALNSVVEDFTEGGVLDGRVGGTESFLYNKLQDIEAELFDRASYTGVLPVLWRIAMHPLLWSEVIKYLPCEMAANSCVGSGSTDTVNVNANDGGNGLFNLSMRQQLARTQTLELNGRVIDVVVDNFIPVTVTPPAPPDEPHTLYTSSIFFIPFTIAGGQRVLWLEHMDYNEISPALSPIPNTQDMYGWTDNARFHHAIIRDLRCFKINTKIEPVMIFIAPHLAGRLDNVTVCPSVTRSIPATS